MNKKLIILLTLFYCTISGAFSQQEVATEEKAQALFVYNFSKHIGWPESSFTSSEFVIGVVGSKRLYYELCNITKEKTVGKYNIVVKFYKNTDELESNHILVLSNSSGSIIDSYKTKIGSFPTLIVNTVDNTIGDIILKMVDQKMSYKISRNGIKNKGLIMSKRLEEMASNVI